MRTLAADFIGFSRHFLRYAFYVRSVLAALLLLVLLGAVAISLLEGLRWGESIYFAFITGLTVGYGDITPLTPWGRAVSVAIGTLGILFTGIIIAVATRALSDTVKQVGSEQARDPKT